MGLRLFSNWSGGDAPAPVPPNPNPGNFRVLKAESIGPFLAVKVLYPDCTNYEGRKILVYRGITIEDFCRETRVDPHFSDDKVASPLIARFVPTEQGWEYAKLFCHIASKERLRS